MQAALFVMAILGCGEGDAPCREVTIAPATYQSREACLAATEASLERHSDLQFPVVVAECRRQGENARPLRGSEVALPDRDRRPNAWGF